MGEESKENRALNAFKKSKLGLVLIVIAIWVVSRIMLNLIGWVILPIICIVTDCILVLAFIVTLGIFIGFAVKHKAWLVLYGIVAAALLYATGIIAYFYNAFYCDYYVADFDGTTYWAEDNSWFDTRITLYEKKGAIFRSRDCVYSLSEVLVDNKDPYYVEVVDRLDKSQYKKVGNAYISEINRTSKRMVIEKRE